MKDIQDLLDRIMLSLKKHDSLSNIEKSSSNDGMNMYHRGNINAYNDVASKLVNYFGCEVSPSSISTSE
jgi:NMD protein affecting ribosome stability and mRNA decay